MITSRARNLWKELPTAVQTALVADLLNNTGTGLVVAFTAVYVARVHEHGPTAGALAVAAIAAGSLPSNAVAGRFADRWNPLVVVAAGWVLAALGDFILVIASGTAALLAGCVVVGAGVGAAYPALNALLGELTDGEVRRIVFGVHHGLVNAGFSIGAIAAAAIVARDTLGRFQLLYSLDAASFLAATVVLLLAGRSVVARPPRSAETTTKNPGSYRSVLSDRSFRKLCTLTGVLVVFGFSQFYAALPLVLSRPGGLRGGAIAIVFAANTVTVACAALPVAAATRRAPRPTLVASGAVCFAACWGLLDVSSRAGGGTAAMVLAVAAAAVMAIGETLLTPSLGPAVNDLAPDSLRGRYNAVDSLVLSFGTLSGPILAGLLLSDIGSSGLLIALFAGCMVAGLIAVSKPVSSALGGGGSGGLLPDQEQMTV
jgi:MFS family permease